MYKQFLLEAMTYGTSSGFRFVPSSKIMEQHLDKYQSNKSTIRSYAEETNETRIIHLIGGIAAV